jgi:site-specific recombinase XerD
MESTSQITGTSVGELATSFTRSLRAENKSERTVETYGEACRGFARFLEERGMPLVVDAITREHVEAFMDYLLRRWKPATASNRYRALQRFFAFAIEEGEIRENSMRNMKPPKVPESPPAVLGDDELRALLHACEGSGFDERRDTAIIRVFIDTGLGYPRSPVLESRMLISISWCSS